MKNKIQKINLKLKNKIVKSLSYKDYYFNSLDPIGESKYVFLEANKLSERFKNCKNFVLSELGFGTGLNFLLTWNLWISLRKEKSRLHYISFEKNPLTNGQLKKIHESFKELKNLSSKLIKRLPSLQSGAHEIYFNDGCVTLTLVYEDFNFLKNLSFLSDAWFLDGFSPSKNKSAWKESILNDVYLNTKVKGTFSTFTAASNVKKNLIKSGFELKKIKGFNKKREMIIGHKKEKKDNHYKLFFYARKKIAPVAIIGSGISGASIAYALKKRNIECFIIEKNNDLAQGASGNHIALQLPKLTLDNSIQGILSLTSFLYSRNLAINLNCSPKTEGVIVFPSQVREILKFKKLIQYNWPTELFHEYKGMFNNDDKITVHKFSSSGIVDNKKLIEKLSLGIKFINNFKVKKIIDDTTEKHLINDTGKSISAKSVIWANGYEMKEELKNNLIIPVAGQVTYLKETDLSKKIKLNFSYGKFISQSYLGMHQIGSTFNRKDHQPSRLNDLENLKNLPIYFYDLFNLDSYTDFQSRTSVRGSTKNRLPFFGTIYDNNEYFLGGMGSWGFIYAPFLAEVLVKDILEEPILLDKKVLRSLDIKNYL